MSCLLEAATVCVDPGHGGSDPGAVAGSVREKDVALVYADALATELRGLGHRVVMTRQEDVFVPLAERSRIANAVDATLFVSLHCNASSNTEAHWAWVLHARPSTRGKALAGRVCTALAQLEPSVIPCRPDKVLPDESPATGGRRLHVLRATRMPAILVELGFLTHPADRRDLTHPPGAPATARVVAAGIEAWLRAERLPAR